EPVGAWGDERRRPHRDVQGLTPMMDDQGQSDSLVVPTKSPNNAAEPAAEAMEGSGLAESNSPESHDDRTQRRTPASDGLERVRQAARRDRKQRFTALLHHVYDLARLRAAYLALSRDAAAGVDGETWRQYGETLEENLRDLAARVKRGAFRARRARRGPPWLLRYARPRMAHPLCGAPYWGPARRAPHREVVEGRRAGGRAAGAE